MSSERQPVRSIIRSALLAACLGAAFPANAGTVTFATADPAVAGGDITVRGILRKPPGQGPFPAVVLLHTCGGLRAHVSEHWPDFLSAQGYAALAVDSFGSRGLGPCPNDLVPPPRGTRTFASRAMISDAHGALDWLEEQGIATFRRVAVMGFSLGGMAIHFSLLRSYSGVRRSRAFDAAVVLYGPCAVRRGAVTMPRLDRSPLPLLEIIGARDGRILRECGDLLPGHPTVELRVLPDAYHNFDNPAHVRLRRSWGGSPMLFSAEATMTARELVRVFLARELGKP